VFIVLLLGTESVSSVVTVAEKRINLCQMQPAINDQTVMRNAALGQLYSA